METIKTSENINKDRRRLLGTAAMSIAVRVPPACFPHIWPPRPKAMQSAPSPSTFRRSNSSTFVGASRRHGGR